MELVVESLKAEDVAAWARERAIPLEELTARRARFLAAGCEALRALEPGERWIQIASALELDPGAARLLDNGLPELIETWIGEGKVIRFAFMHKPPGLRLRFSSCVPEFRDELAACSAQWGVGAWSFTFYEPEQYQFGGPRGMDLAHDYFTIESIAVLKYKDAMRRGSTNLKDWQFSLLMLHELLNKVTGDRWELWDVWCNMQLTGRLAAEDLTPPSDLAELRAEMLPFLFDASTATRKMTAREGQIWECYKENVAALVAKIREAGRTGQLLWPLRQILPFWVVFHWNRMGFGIERQRRLARAMAVVLSTKW